MKTKPQEKYKKILSFLEKRKATMSEIANKNNINWDACKNAIDLLTELDIIEEINFKKKIYYAIKPKEPKFWFIVEQSINSMNLDELGYLVHHLKIKITERIIDNEQQDNIY